MILNVVALPRTFHDARCPQLGEVQRDYRLRNAERFANLFDVAALGGNTVHDAQAYRMAEYFKFGGKRLISSEIHCFPLVHRIRAKPVSEYIHI